MNLRRRLRAVETGDGATSSGDPGDGATSSGDPGHGATSSGDPAGRRDLSEDDHLIAASLRAAGRGDQDAFATFYDMVSPLVYGVVLKIVRDPAMAEEVAQEVFVELWRLAPRFDAERGSGRTWSATIAHRRAVDRVRSEQAHRRRTETEGRKAVISHDQTIETVVERLDVVQVRQALDGLSDGQRQAVELAYYGGHTYREVAVLLDVPEGTIKTRIRDGLIRLRDHLGVTS